MSFTVNDESFDQGTKGYTMLKVAPMLNGSTLQVPVHVVKGEKEGPTLGLFACIHGSEYYQNRVIRTMVAETDPEELRGTVVAVPVANPYAFMHMSRQTPLPPEETVDFANLNRVFPGRRETPLFGSMVSSDVSLTMRIAAVLSDQVIPRCTHILDYHGQMRGMALKKMLFNLDPDSKEMARVFGLGILHDPPGTVRGGRSLMHMTEYAGTLGIKCIVPEIGGGGHGEAFEAECERLGVQGTLNVMKHLGMMDGDPVLPEKQFYFRNAPHVRSTVGGYLVTNMQPSDVGIGRNPREVREGETLGTIYSPYTLEELEEVKAPCDGLIYACRVSGPVEPQNELLAVADYEGSEWIM